MADYEYEKLDQSLWAISQDGILWQINTRNCQAAPVAPLNQLPLHDRKVLQKEMIALWSKQHPHIAEFLKSANASYTAGSRTVCASSGAE